MGYKTDLFKKMTTKFDIKRDKKRPTGFKLINTKVIGYKQCKNTFPSPQTDHNLRIVIVKFLYCKCISLIIKNNLNSSFV